MPAVAYLTRSPDGADMNGLLAEFDRRLAIALNGNSPLVPCVRGSSTGNNATLSALWSDMFNRTHDLLGYRFSFTDGSATHYHDLAALQVGAWADYDHAALQAIAAAATPGIQDDTLQIVTVTSTTDTDKLEGSLEAHRYEVSAGVFYWINVYGRPLRRHTYAVAELVCEGKTTLTVPREWDRFECYRVHNLSPADLVVTVEDASPTEVSHTFTVKPYGVKAFRRPKSGAFDDSLTYFWKFRVNSDRPAFLEASGITTANRSIPEQSARANPLARPFGILDWFAHFGLELDPRELPDQSALFPNFHTPATASVFGDLIHFRGVVWSIAYPTDTTLPAVIGKGQFNGYQTLVGDFASIGIEATESGGVITLDRATNADGDAANGLDVFSPSSNILHDGAFGSFCTLPFDLESTAQLRWSATPFTAAVTTTTLTVKTLTDADPVTYSTDTATIPKLTVTPLRHAISQRARTLNVATLTTADAHGFTVGQVVLVYGVGGTGYNGQVEVTVVPTPTTFRYASFAANEATTTDSGGTGYAQGQKTRAQLSDSAEPPTTSGVHWQGTWRLTPCGWRASWQYEVALTGPGLLEDFENASTDGLLDSIYDDITEDGIAVHRGMVAVVGQGWPMDDADTVFTAGEGNPHSLTPCHSREVRHQETDGTIGDYDPGFSGYTGTADGADIAKEDREADKYSGLKILAPLTFRRNPSTLAATHKLANITDSAHVPIIQESVACDDPASIFAQRADLNTETAAVPEVDGTSAGTAFHYLPILPSHFNLLAYHVNAWTRCVPLCTVSDVVLVKYADTGLAQDVFLTLGMLDSTYSRGVSGVGISDGSFEIVHARWLCDVPSDAVTELEAVGLTVRQSSTDDTFIAAEAEAQTVLDSTPKSLTWNVYHEALSGTAEFVNPILSNLTSATPPLVDPGHGAAAENMLVPGDIYKWETQYDVKTTITDTGPGSGTDFTTAEADYAQDLVDEFTAAASDRWVSADDAKEFAETIKAVFCFEAFGVPVVLTAFESETPAILIDDTVYKTTTYTAAFKTSNPNASPFIVALDGLGYQNGLFPSGFSIPSPPTVGGSFPADTAVYGVAGSDPFATFQGYVWSGTTSAPETGPWAAGTGGLEVAGAMVRWVPVADNTPNLWLVTASTYYGPPSAIRNRDDLFTAFNFSTGIGGPRLDLAFDSLRYVLNLGDNGPGGIAFENLYSSPYGTPVGPDGGAGLAVSDGRPAEVRSVDRGLFQSFAVVNETHDPTDKLVSNTRLVGYKAYNLVFDGDWMTDAVENLAFGSQGIPRTVTDGYGSIITKQVVKNTVTILEPGTASGAWRVSTRRNVFFNLA